MFWGCVLKDGKAYKTQSALEESDYPVLHISNVALPKNAPAGKLYLLASMGKDLQGLTLATLQKDKIESVSLDLYVNVSQQITLTVSGAPGAELHLSGFFEPQRSDEEDDAMFMNGEEDEEDEEEEVAGPSTKNLNQSLQAAKANAMKNAAVAQDEDDDEDDDDYDLEDDDEELEDEDDEDDDEPVVPVKPV